MTYVSSEPVKRTLPPPFERPKIEVSAAGRSWQWINPEHIEENDIIPDFGLIKAVDVYEEQDPYRRVAKVVGAGKTEKFEQDSLIWAFTRKPT